MIQRIHLKKTSKKNFKINKKKLKKRDKFIIVIFVLILTITIAFKYISDKVTPSLMLYAEKKATSISTILITQAVNDNVFKELDKKNLFVEVKDKNGNIISTDFNPVIVNKIINKITNYTEKYLEKLETGSIEDLELSDTILSNYNLKNLKKGVIYEIPTGIVFNNAMFANLGPKVPVKVNLNGDVVTDLKTSVESYGINNALIKVSVNVKVYMQVMIPFKSKEIVVETNVPIIMKLVQGSVPDYYNPYSNK